MVDVRSNSERQHLMISSLFGLLKTFVVMYQWPNSWLWFFCCLSKIRRNEQTTHAHVISTNTKNQVRELLTTTPTLTVVFFFTPVHLYQRHDQIVRIECRTRRKNKSRKVNGPFDSSSLLVAVLKTNIQNRIGLNVKICVCVYCLTYFVYS